jgi:hypothetical protein
MPEPDTRCADNRTGSPLDLSYPEDITKRHSRHGQPPDAENSDLRLITNMPLVTTSTQIGGSARGYLELFAPVGNPDHSGEAVFLCIGSARRERPVMPLGAH